MTVVDALRPRERTVHDLPHRVCVYVCVRMYTCVHKRVLVYRVVQDLTVTLSESGRGKIVMKIILCGDPFGRYVNLRAPYGTLQYGNNVFYYNYCCYYLLARI